MRATHVPIVLVACLALAAASAFAAPAAGPQAREDKDKFVLQNSDVQVWFQGKKPTLHLLRGDATDNGSAVLTYKFTQVVEYRDLDGNGAPSDNEVVASLNLDRADGWKANVSTAEGLAALNLSLVDQVRVGQADLPKSPVALPGGADREAQVRLLFALRGADVNLPMGPVNATVLATSVKYDFAVDKWPFVDAANDRLALEMQVTGAVKNANFSGLQRAAVAGANGTAIGALSWTTTAQGRVAGNASVPVPVKADVAAEKDATGAATGMTRIAFTYDAPGLASLVHDPTVGLFPVDVASVSTTLGTDASLHATPGAGLLAIVGAGVGVALLARRK